MSEFRDWVSTTEAATRQAWEARTTATAVMAHATMTRQAEKREQALGAVRGYGLPFLLILVSGVVLVVSLDVLRDCMNRPVQYDRSILGDFQPLAFKGRNGDWTLVHTGVSLSAVWPTIEIVA